MFYCRIRYARFVFITRGYADRTRTGAIFAVFVVNERFHLSRAIVVRVHRINVRTLYTYNRARVCQLNERAPRNMYKTCGVGGIKRKKTEKKTMLSVR